MTELSDLITRLRATKTQYKVRSAFGGNIGFIDEEETREVPINPDGPEAADVLERLSQERAATALRSSQARVAELEADLKPFADAFHAKVQNPRVAQVRRDWNEQMPGEWPIDLTVTMTDGRVARDVLDRSTPPAGEPNDV